MWWRYLGFANIKLTKPHKINLYNKNFNRSCKSQLTTCLNFAYSELNDPADNLQANRHILTLGHRHHHRIESPVLGLQSPALRLDHDLADHQLVALMLNQINLTVNYGQPRAHNQDILDFVMRRHSVIKHVKTIIDGPF